MHDDFQPVLAAADATDLLHPGPLLRLYNSRRHWETEGWRWQLRVDAGTRYSLLDDAALHAAEPALSDAAGFAVAFPDRPFIADPGALVLRLKACLARAGVRFIDGMAQSFERRGESVSAIRLVDGTRCPAGGW